MATKTQTPQSSLRLRSAGLCSSARCHLVRLFTNKALLGVGSPRLQEKIAQSASCSSVSLGALARVFWTYSAVSPRQTALASSAWERVGASAEDVVISGQPQRYWL